MRLTCICLSPSGDLEGLRRCLYNGEDVNALIDLPNQNKQLVVGVTPLYLAAQRGNLVRASDACRERAGGGGEVRVEGGANRIWQRSAAS